MKLVTPLRRHSQLQLTCCFTGVAVRLQQVARATGAAVGALGVDAGLAARPSPRPLALVHILADSATALQLKASLAGTHLKEGGGNINTF